MLIEALDELSFDVEEDGRQVRRMLDRRILARGSWATVVFLYQELDLATDRWRAAKVAMVRFQKQRGGWRKHTSLTIAGEAAARELAAVLVRWFDNDAKTARGDTVQAAELVDDSDDGHDEA